MHLGFFLYKIQIETEHLVILCEITIGGNICRAVLQYGMLLHHASWYEGFIPLIIYSELSAVCGA